jgi:hypothetical protein
VILAHPGKPPRALLNALGVPRAAKPLIAAALPGGGWLVATDLGLAVAAPGTGAVAWADTDAVAKPDTDAGDSPEDGSGFFPWDMIDRARLRKKGAVLSVEVTGESRPRVFALQPKDKRFASVVNERIRASVVDVRHIPTPAGQVIVALRRSPADQGLRLQELVPPGVEPGDVALLIRSARDALAEAAGMEPGS